MTSWTSDELDRIGRAQEVEVASRRADGSLSPYVTIWGVRVGDDIYIRSAYGPDNGWYRRAKARGTGRIRADGIERDVCFVEPDAGVHPGIDAAYHAKYDRHGPRIVGSVVGVHAAAVTLRLDPAGETR
jgi:hypothetical protein